MDSLSSISKKFIAFYLGWIFIHVLLFINGKDYSGFYPFDDGIAKVKDYGSIELIVYLGVPLIGFIIYSLLKTKDGSQLNNSDSGDIFSTLKEKSTIEIIAKLKSANSDKNMVETDSVVGPTGEQLTLKDLPPKDTKRWVVRRKAEVVAAVRGGLLSLEDSCRKYTLSVEEFLSWQRAIDEDGLLGLRTTRVQDYRQDKSKIQNH